MLRFTAGGFPAKRTLLVTAISRYQKTSHPNLNHEKHPSLRQAQYKRRAQGKRKATKGAKCFRGLRFWVQLSHLTCTQIVRNLAHELSAESKKSYFPTSTRSKYAATRFVLDAKVGFEMRPGGVGVGNGLRPTLCRSSESHLRQTRGGFWVLPNKVRCGILV